MALESAVHGVARADDRSAEGGQGLQAAQLSGFAAVGARADGRARRGVDSVVEQLPRAVRRAARRRSGHRRASKRYGAGTASVRFICGTFTIHRELEEALAKFVGCEASLSFVSAWNANEGFTATVAQEGDFIVSDALNHASIIDSMRLAKAISEVHDRRLQARRHGRPARQARRGEGREAANDLDGRHLLDGGRDRQAAGDPPDRARHEFDRRRRRLARDRRARQDGTRDRRALRRARRGRHHHVDARQSARRRGRRVRRRTRSARRLSHAAVAAAAVLERAAADRGDERARRGATSSSEHPSASRQLRQNTTYFREQITEAGFKPIPGETPIMPIIVGETAAAIQMSDMLLDEGVFVTGFGFPVVPHGTGARALPDLGGTFARRSRSGDPRRSRRSAQSSASSSDVEEHSSRPRTVLASQAHAPGSLDLVSADSARNFTARRMQLDDVRFITSLRCIDHTRVRFLEASVTV